MSSLRQIANNLRHIGSHALPYSCTFIHEIPPELRPVVEAKLKAAFELWWNSWVEPGIKQIEARVPAITKAKE